MKQLDLFESMRGLTLTTLPARTVAKINRRLKAEDRANKTQLNLRILKGNK